MEKQKAGRRRKRTDKRKRLILIIDGVLLLALIAAAVLLALRIKNGDKQSAVTPPPPAALQDAEAAVPAAGTGGQTGSAAEGTDFERTFTTLQQEGVPVVGWLSCPGTAIDYPVVQNVDDEYYMTRDIYGKKDNNGAIYLDGRNSAELLDGQIMIYGNPMADGSMFGSLVYYRQQEYFAAHPTLSLYTPEKTYTIRVFAAHLTSPDRSNYPTWFETSDTRAAYIQQVCAMSAITTELEIPADARLVSLVTSSDFEAGDNSRFVVHGFLEES